MARKTKKFGQFVSVTVDDSRLDDILKHTKDGDGKVVDIGFIRAGFEGTKALFNEFGTKGAGGRNAKGQFTKRGGIPSRPFMRDAFDANSKEYATLLAQGWSAVASGKGSFEGALTEAGILADNDMKRSLTDLSSPPNAPATIALKGSSNPLIDTGVMRNAISFEIKRVSS